MWAEPCQYPVRVTVTHYVVLAKTERSWVLGFLSPHKGRDEGLGAGKPGFQSSFPTFLSV